MTKKLIVTLNDGSTEEFTLASNYTYSGNEWRYDIRDGLLRIIQGSEVTTFPLTSVIRWNVRNQ